MMNKIKFAAAILAVAGGLLAAPSAASAATAGTAESVYTVSGIHRCADANDGVGYACVNLGAASTYSATQIWINGHVDCYWWADEPIELDITWCGVGGGNGTAVLNIGINWQIPTWSAHGLYERMDILANHGGCSTWGTNSAVGKIYTWANAALQCEAPA
jgi:hypothetical protein